MKERRWRTNLRDPSKRLQHAQDEGNLIGTAYALGVDARRDRFPTCCLIPAGIHHHSEHLSSVTCDQTTTVTTKVREIVRRGE